MILSIAAAILWCAAVTLWLRETRAAQPDQHARETNHSR
jgi:hypothetical protein